jgi:hypothetical protein
MVSTAVVGRLKLAVAALSLTGGTTWGLCPLNGWIL